eukprot:1030090-Rhodomonas_salina.1
MSTSATSLSRWGTIEFTKLASTLYRSPALFIPSTCSPHIATSGGWWKCTGHRLDRTNDCMQKVLFDGMWLPAQECSTLTENQITALIRASPEAPHTIQAAMTAEELGQPKEGSLFRPVHDYWMSERRQGQPVPVEIECRMPQDLLVSRTAPRQGK